MPIMLKYSLIVKILELVFKVQTFCENLGNVWLQ